MATNAPEATREQFAATAPLADLPAQAAEAAKNNG